MTGSNVTYAFSGGVRETGDADESLNRCVPVSFVKYRGMQRTDSPSLQACDWRRPCVSRPAPLDPVSPGIHARHADLSSPFTLAVLKGVWQI